MGNINKIRFRDRRYGWKFKKEIETTDDIDVLLKWRRISLADFLDNYSKKYNIEQINGKFVIGNSRQALLYKLL